MTVDESILRRAFVTYDDIPEPPKFPPKFDEPPPPTNEDVARNAQAFPELYLFLTVRRRVEQAWGWFTRGGPVVRILDPSRSRSATPSQP